MYLYFDFVGVDNFVDEFVNKNWDDIVTPIKVHRLKYWLENTKYDLEKTQQIVRGYEQGFDIGYRGPTERRDLAQNIPISVGSKTDMWNKIMKEVKLGHYAGPFKFEELPFNSFVQSPIGLVPIAGNQTQLIFHLSFDFGQSEEKRSINYHTPENFCTVHYRDLDFAVRACLHLKGCLALDGRFYGNEDGDDNFSGLFLGKSDLKSTFRILPILVSQRRFLLLKANHPITGELQFFVEKNLPFGASSSCKIFTEFCNCLQHIIQTIEERNFSRNFRITNYLDDFLFIHELQVS